MMQHVKYRHTESSAASAKGKSQLGVATVSEVLSDAVFDHSDSAGGTFGLHGEWPGAVGSLFDGLCVSI